MIGQSIKQNDNTITGRAGTSNPYAFPGIFMELPTDRLSFKISHADFSHEHRGTVSVSFWAYEQYSPIIRIQHNNDAASYF
jgi:hypothetical protein